MTSPAPVVPVTGTTPFYGIEYLIEGEPAWHTRQKLERNARTVEAALLRGGAPPAWSDAVEFVARFAVSVRGHGAVGDGVADDTEAFRAALAAGERIVFVPAGTYLIRGFLRVYARTWVLMHPDAVLLNDSQDSETVFVNGPHGDATYATGYAGDGDLRFTGGTIDMAPRKARGVTGQAFAIGHADTVTIEGVRMRNQRSGHFIEINACRTVAIRDCMFDNLDPAGQTNREAINIDFSGAAQFPALGAYDGTPCEDVLIENCTFSDLQVAVGSHSFGDPARPHRNIRIRDCVFRRLSGNAVHAYNWRGGYVRGCRLGGVDTEGIELSGSFDLTVEGNELTDCGRGTNAYYSAVFVSAGAGGVLGGGHRIGPNRVSSTHPNRFSVAYDVQDGTGTTVTTAGADLGTKGYTVEDTGSLTVIDGAYGLTMADDTVVALPVPGTNKQGMVLISMQSTTSFAPRGLYWVRAAAGNSVITPVAAVAAADVVTTTNVKTVATATDVKFTVAAADDGLLYLINRSGAARRIAVSFPALG